MKKIKLGVVFGGMSTENEVSFVSGMYVLKNLDREKYDVYPIYIDKTGNWYEYNDEINPEIRLDEIKKINLISNLVEYLKKLDKIFPVLHGLYGEDGTIQGLFEMLKIPYVGCGVLASSVGMDKVYSKIVFKNAGFKQTKYCYVRKENNKYIYINEEFDEETCDINAIAEKIETRIKYPMFIKPSNSGSSVGVNKANNIKELINCIEEAGKYDTKILVEEGINAREVECAVIGNKDYVMASCTGEILSAEEFYSFDAKYKIQESKTIIPANISVKESEVIRKLAIKAFKCIDGKGLSRVDFFIDKNTKEIYINEINTMPGFTQISMFPKLFEQIGINYSELLDKLIEIE